MDKIKKISINEFETAVNDEYEEYLTVEWRNISVIIKHTLSLSEMVAFVDSVSAACFNEEDMAYAPEAEDFAVRTAIIELYTNIRLPSNLHKRYDLLYRSDIVDVVCNYINHSQFDVIMHATHKKITHNADVNIAATTKQMEQLYAAFENIQTQMSNMFGDVEADDIKNLINVIGNSKIDEEKIVKALNDK